MEGLLYKERLKRLEFFSLGNETTEEGNVSKFYKIMNDLEKANRELLFTVFQSIKN